jgi:hypothetical protein
MFTGAAIIGKLVELIASKLLGRAIDLTRDERRRVCRGMTALYFSVERLEELVEEVIRGIERSLETSDPNSAVGTVLRVSPSLDALSQRFYDEGEELYWALTIFDPALAKAVSDLFMSKFSFLHFIQESVSVGEQWPAKPGQQITFLEPSPEVLSLDVEAYYTWLRENDEKPFEERSTLNWPTEALQGRLDRLFKERQIALVDADGWRDLLGILVVHLEHLSRARELLRTFLAANFKIDEVLYVGKSLRPGMRE